MIDTSALVLIQVIEDNLNNSTVPDGAACRPFHTVEVCVFSSTLN